MHLPTKPRKKTSTARRASWATSSWLSHLHDPRFSCLNFPKIRDESALTSVLEGIGSSDLNSKGMILEKKFTFPAKKNHVPWKKYLQPLEKKFGLLWPCGPVVLWSSGPLVVWSFGPVVLWSCRPLVLWPSGPLVLWSSGPLLLWSSGAVVVLWSCSALVLWSQKFYELRANHVACFANASGGEALRPPQPPSSQVQVECLNFFSRVLIFFPGVSGGEALKFVFQGYYFFFSRAYPIAYPIPNPAQNEIMEVHKVCYCVSFSAFGFVSCCPDCNPGEFANPKEITVFLKRLLPRGEAVVHQARSARLHSPQSALEFQELKVGQEKSKPQDVVANQSPLSSNRALTCSSW